MFGSPTIWFAAALAAGIVAVYQGLPLLAALGASAAAGLVGRFLGRTRTSSSKTVSQLPLALALGFAAGAGLGDRHYHVFPADHIRNLVGEETRVAVLEGVIRTEPVTRRLDHLQWTTFRLEAESCSPGGEPRPASGSVFVLASRPDAVALRYGQRVRLSGKLGPTQAPQNPGEVDRRVSSAHDRVHASLTLGSSGAMEVLDDSAASPLVRAILDLKRRMRSALRETVSADAAAFLESILLGAREELSADVVDDFTRTGTVHILAISGQHLSLLCGMLWLVLRRGLRAPERPSGLAVLGFASVYCVMTGATPAILRATIMIGIVVAGRLRSRDASTLDSLAIAGTVILGLDPGDLFNIGFQLSFAAILGIELLFRPVHELFVATLPPMGARPSLARRAALHSAWLAGDTVLLSVACALATTPLVLYHFHIATPGTVLANAAIVAPVWLVLNAGMATLLLAPVSASLAQPFAWLASRASEALMAIVDALARVPGMFAYCPDIGAGQVALAYAALAALAIAAGRGLRPRWLTGLALVGFVAALVPPAERRPAPGAAEVAVLSVGKGQTVVVRTGGANALFDCGSGRVVDPAGRQVAPYLWTRGVRRIDAIFLSSAESEHVNALEGVLDRFAVAAVVVPRRVGGGWEGRRLLERLRARGVRLEWIEPGETHSRLPGLRVEALRSAADVTRSRAYAPEGLGGPGGAPRPPERGGAGERRAIYRISTAGGRILLCGDAADSEIDEATRGGRGVAEVVVLPRHGGRIEDVATFVSRVRPRIAIASARESSVHAETVCALQDSGVPVALTWATGCVDLLLSESGLALRGHAGTPPLPAPARREEPAGPRIPTLDALRLSVIPDADDGINETPARPPKATRRGSRPAAGTDEEGRRRFGSRRPSSPARAAEGGAMAER